MVTSRSNVFAVLATNAVAGLAVAAAIAVAPARADPDCTEDCGVDKGQYELPPLYMKGGLQLPIDIHHAIITSHAICDRLNQGATRDQVRSIAGDGSPQQQDVVINAAIKVYCPGVKA